MGWSAAWFSEVEPFPSAVLAHRWPHVANLGDMTQLPTLIAAGVVPAPDILVGGTPCQAFSVAGMRKGLDDERGQLTIKYVEVANEIDGARPRGEECIAVWENVPGVLSDKSNAFGCFLGALVGEDDPLEPAGKKWGNAGIVYGPQRVAAWRVLDAQYFGVAQRRRRVFVIASARKGFDPAAVLFESESLRRDTPPSREAGSPVAALTANGVGTCGADDNQGQAGHLIASGWQADIACTLNASFGDKQGLEDQHINGGAPLFVPTVVHGTQDPCVSDKAFALGRNGGQENVVAFSGRNRGAEPKVGRLERPPLTMIEKVGALDTVKPWNVATGTTVRRLTPRECERLQGFPDDHTNIPWKLYQESKRKGWSYEGELIKRGLRLKGSTVEDCPDGPRYKAIGNSKAIPVIKWVGLRIKKHLEEI
jgi:DNA (cytosine-5)-methyltransferase 1